jgi:hypothetical protein
MTQLRSIPWTVTTVTTGFQNPFEPGSRSDGIFWITLSGTNCSRGSEERLML